MSAKKLLITHNNIICSLCFVHVCSFLLRVVFPCLPISGLLNWNPKWLEGTNRHRNNTKNFPQVVPSHTVRSESIQVIRHPQTFFIFCFKKNASLLSDRHLPIYVVTIAKSDSSFIKFPHGHELIRIRRCSVSKSLCANGIEWLCWQTNPCHVWYGILKIAEHPVLDPKPPMRMISKIFCGDK